MQSNPWHHQEATWLLLLLIFRTPSRVLSPLPNHLWAKGEMKAQRRGMRRGWVVVAASTGVV